MELSIVWGEEAVRAFSLQLYSLPTFPNWCGEGVGATDCSVPPSPGKTWLMRLKSPHGVCGGKHFKDIMCSYSPTLAKEQSEYGPKPPISSLDQTVPGLGKRSEELPPALLTSQTSQGRERSSTAKLPTPFSHHLPPQTRRGTCRHLFWREKNVLTPGRSLPQRCKFPPMKLEKTMFVCSSFFQEKWFYPYKCNGCAWP